jgi:hypothetical protein
VYDAAIRFGPVDEKTFGAVKSLAVAKADNGVPRWLKQAQTA